MDQYKRDHRAGTSVAETQTEYRVVLVNHGPAAARTVTLIIRDGNGKDIGTRLVMATLPVPKIHPGQTYIVPILGVMGAIPDVAELTWRDGRRDEQTETFHLSLIEV